MMRLFFAIGVATTVVALAADLPTENLCVQPSPEEMAKAVGVTLPKLPWHVVNIWWDFEKPAAHFESLAVDVTIDRDVPLSYNLYYPSKTGPAAPDCAVAKADGANVRVEVGPIFQRDEGQRRHDLSLMR